MYTIENEREIFNDIFIIEDATIHYKNSHFRRLRINKQAAVAVLVLNSDTNKFILTKQFRYPIAAQHPEPFLEILAGVIDPNESPEVAALREAEEEIGYRIKPSNLQFLYSCYPTPGYSSELFHLYFATVTEVDKVSNGGGLQSEHENIELVEIEKEKFYTLLKEGKLKDGKTYLAGLYHLLHP
ncbi:MAG: NUDIX hydrolase [Bacteroidetes bacterium]|nr:NUDIX hydrolase [Bacteroidota bacterium]